MKPPKRIKVGPFSVKFKIDPQGILDACVEAAEAVRGYVNCFKLQASVAPGLDKQVEREVVLHETLHVAWSAANLPPKYEEECVTALAVWLLMIGQENPELIEYLGWK